MSSSRAWLEVALLHVWIFVFIVCIHDCVCVSMIFYVCVVHEYVCLQYVLIEFYRYLMVSIDIHMAHMAPISRTESLPLVVIV